MTSYISFIYHLALNKDENQNPPEVRLYQDPNCPTNIQFARQKIFRGGVTPPHTPPLVTALNGSSLQWFRDAAAAA